MGEATRLCRVEELRAGAGRFVAVGDRELAVFLVAGRVHVLDNACPHMGGNLSAGQVHRGVLECPLHHWQFVLSSGRCPDAADVAVRRYRCEVRDGEVWADLGEADEQT
jgi:nitrite reductase/ring-hydroxylating ferredoxin subunit